MGFKCEHAQRRRNLMVLAKDERASIAIAVVAAAFCRCLTKRR